MKHTKKALKLIGWRFIWSFTEYIRVNINTLRPGLTYMFLYQYSCQRPGYMFFNVF